VGLGGWGRVLELMRGREGGWLEWRSDVDRVGKGKREAIRVKVGVGGTVRLGE